MKKWKTIIGCERPAKGLTRLPIGREQKPAKVPMPRVSLPVKSGSHEQPTTFPWNPIRRGEPHPFTDTSEMTIVLKACRIPVTPLRPAAGTTTKTKLKDKDMKTKPSLEKTTGPNTATGHLRAACGAKVLSLLLLLAMPGAAQAQAPMPAHSEVDGGWAAAGS